MIVYCILCKYVIQVCIGRIHLLAIMCFSILHHDVYARISFYYISIVPEINFKLNLTKSTIFFNSSYQSLTLFCPSVGTRGVTTRASQVTRWRHTRQRSTVCPSTPTASSSLQLGQLTR